MSQLQHFSYQCPGLSGPQSRMTVRPRSFQKLFQQGGEDGAGVAPQIIIPLFQRKYCWNKDQLVGWWGDVLHGRRDVPGGHSVGKIIFTRESAQGRKAPDGRSQLDHAPTDDVLLCVDGQQRITTTQLLMAALRDAALRLATDPRSVLAEAPAGHAASDGTAALPDASGGGRSTAAAAHGGAAKRGAGAAAAAAAAAPLFAGADADRELDVADEDVTMGAVAGAARKAAVVWTDEQCAAIARRAMVLAQRIEGVLHRDTAAAGEWHSTIAARLAAGACTWDAAIGLGATLPFSTLLPSFVDRRPYFELLTMGRVAFDLRRLRADGGGREGRSAAGEATARREVAGEATARREVAGEAKAEREVAGSDDAAAAAAAATAAVSSASAGVRVPEHARGTHQWLAKSYFDSVVWSHLQQHVATAAATGADGGDVVKVLASVCDRALNTMVLMFVEILNKVNLAQVFLWLQERTLFGMGAVLYNPTPGVDFCASDMVRNLLLSAFMDRPIWEQERLYRKHWLQPLEFRHAGPLPMDRMLRAFLNAEHARADAQWHARQAAKQAADAARQEASTGAGAGTGVGTGAGAGSAVGSGGGGDVLAPLRVLRRRDANVDRHGLHRFVGDFEKKMVKMLTSLTAQFGGKKNPERSSILLYAEFVSWFEAHKAALADSSAEQLASLLLHTILPSLATFSSSFVQPSA